ncbi:hypothetical protein PPYR_15454, partial [Photinus pyralis]
MPLTRDQISEINACVAASIKEFFQNDTFIDMIVTRVVDKINVSINDQINAAVDSVKRENVFLREKVDALEQYSRRNNIRLFGIPEEKNENIQEVVIDAFNNVGIPVTSDSIDRLHRVGKSLDSSKTRPIIIKFISYKSKHMVVTSKRKFKGTKCSIQEDLTVPRLQLLKEVQEIVGRKQTWTMDGVIFAKHKDKKFIIKST